MLAAPMDYGDVFPRHFTFTPDTFQEPYCFQVAIEDDLVLEDDEFFELFLSGDIGVRVKNSLRITIVDNDGKVWTSVNILDLLCFFLLAQCMQELYKDIPIQHSREGSQGNHSSMEEEGGGGGVMPLTQAIKCCSWSLPGIYLTSQLS